MAGDLTHWLTARGVACGAQPRGWDWSVTHGLLLRSTTATEDGSDPVTCRDCRRARNAWRMAQGMAPLPEEAPDGR